MSAHTDFPSAEDFDALCGDFCELARLHGRNPSVAAIHLQGLATDPEKVDVLLGAADGPLSMTLAAVYILRSGLATQDEGWSVSCLPRYSGPTFPTRAMTVSIGSREAFWVELAQPTGRLLRWGLLVAETSGMASVDALAERLELDVDPTADGVYVISRTPADRPLDQALWAAALAASTRRLERRPTRRKDWHNPRFAAVLAGAVGGMSQNETRALDQGMGNWEIERAYVESIVRRRRHQRQFRKLVLAEATPRQCRICGIGHEQVSDAAHLVADADGGAASSSNSVLLCANHHRALDRDLLRWDVAKGEPVWRVRPF